jgi:endonuclease YncB( thermonuclease family)
MGSCTSKSPSIEDIRHRQLESCTYNNTDEMTYRFTEAKVINVYDGDTVTIAAFIGDQALRFNVRIYGIDCNEIKGGTIESKIEAQKAKKYVADRLLNKIVKINVLNGQIINGKKIREKYGRLLAIITIDGKSISDELIYLGLAKPYFGGNKSNIASSPRHNVYE